MPDPNRQPLAMDDDGNVLLLVQENGEDVAVPDASLTAALVVLWRDDCLLLVFNRDRQCWELPGGVIDPGSHHGRQPCAASGRGDAMVPVCG